MIKLKSSAKPLIELTLAAAFWGFGFTATVWALVYIDSPAIIFYRFFFTFLISIAILFFQKIKWSDFLHEMKLGFGLGFWLSLTLILQAWSLKYTTATKASFITTLYVVLVPLMSLFLYRQKLNPWHWLWVALAFLGTGLMVELSFNDWNWGDTLVLINAFTASFHILLMGRTVPKSKNNFALNAAQSFWIALFCLVLVVFPTRWNLAPLSPLAWVGILELTLGSSLLAFWLQVRAQNHLSPSTASLLFLLESPFSLVFAMYFLNESLSFNQATGGLLILLACVGVSLQESRSQNAPA